MILLSARAGTEARIEGLSAGADDYITKPFIAKELLARVAALLELSKVRKAAAETVRASMERLGAALEAADTGTFRWDIRTNEVDWDENLDRIFGLAPGVTVRSLDNFLARVHPDDRAEVGRPLRTLPRTKARISTWRCGCCWPDGSEHWIIDKGKTFFDERGAAALYDGGLPGHHGAQARRGRPERAHTAGGTRRRDRSRDHREGVAGQ